MIILKTQLKTFSHSSFLVYYYTDSPSIDGLRFRFFQATCITPSHFNLGYGNSDDVNLCVIFYNEFNNIFYYCSVVLLLYTLTY
jgi:hypothetical protein